MTEQVIDKNIKAIHGIRVEADRKRRWDQKFVDHVASFTGSTNSLFAHVVIYLLCFYYFKSFEKLSMVASLEAMFLAVFVLINQNRMNALERRNADLHLQTSLLTEHELTRLTATVNLIAKKLEIDFAKALHQEIVKPDEVLQRISDHEENAPTASTNNSP